MQKFLTQKLTSKTPFNLSESSGVVASDEVLLDTACFSARIVRHLLQTRHDFPPAYCNGTFESEHLLQITYIYKRKNIPVNPSTYIELN